MTKTSWVLGALALSCASCACPTELTYGVELAITEGAGATADPIEVSYTVDGESQLLDERCADPRTECVLGPELPGEYVIMVRRGTASAMVEASVTANRCHVITRRVPLTLP